MNIFQTVRRKLATEDKRTRVMSPAFAIPQREMIKLEFHVLYPPPHSLLPSSLQAASPISPPSPATLTPRISPRPVRHTPPRRFASCGTLPDPAPDPPLTSRAPNAPPPSPVHPSPAELWRGSFLRQVSAARYFRASFLLCEAQSHPFYILYCTQAGKEHNPGSLDEVSDPFASLPGS